MLQISREEFDLKQSYDGKAVSCCFALSSGQASKT